MVIIWDGLIPNFPLPLSHLAICFLTHSLLLTQLLLPDTRVPPHTHTLYTHAYPARPEVTFQPLPLSSPNFIPPPDRPFLCLHFTLPQSLAPNSIFRVSFPGRQSKLAFGHLLGAGLLRLTISTSPQRLLPCPSRLGRCSPYTFNKPPRAC